MSISANYGSETKGVRGALSSFRATVGGARSNDLARLVNQDPDQLQAVLNDQKCQWAYENIRERGDCGKPARHRSEVHGRAGPSLPGPEEGVHRYAWTWMKDMRLLGHAARQTGDQDRPVESPLRQGVAWPRSHAGRSHGPAQLRTYGA